MKTLPRLCVLPMLLVFPFALLAPAQSQRAPATVQQYLVYVGTYTTKQASKGIYVYRFDSGSGQLKEIGLAAESTDPSFLAVHPNGKYLYAVNEVGDFGGQKSGAVSAFSIDRATGKLKLLNQVASGGAGPCYISLDKTGKFALVANYDGGSVATFPIKEDGSLAAAAAFVQHTGSSVNKERQEGPHAHWIETSPDNRFALAADLGLDEVLVYRFDSSKGTLSPNTPPFVKVNPGSGPRHFAFHPNGKFGYVLSEMAATVTAFSYDSNKGALSILQTVPTLAKDYSGPIEAAELVVHPSGKFLYASNRAGIDTITEFTIDPAKGVLKLADKVSTKGKTPRNFAIDPTGSFLLAANQESGNIIVFRIDPASGALAPTGVEAKVPAPVCVVFAPTDREDFSSQSDGVPSKILTTSSSSPSNIIVRANGRNVKPPVCVHCPSPNYADEALSGKNIQSMIALEILVNTEGRVENVEILTSPSDQLAKKAAKAVRKWRFKPAVGSDGSPVAVRVPVQFAIHLH